MRPKDVDKHQFDGVDEQGFKTKKRRKLELLEDFSESSSSDEEAEKDQPSSGEGRDLPPDNSEGPAKDDMFASDVEVDSTSARGTQNEPASGPEKHEEDALLSNSDSDGGIQMEAFNVDEESKSGTFDKLGNYVESKGNASEEEDELEQDQWINDYKDTKQVRQAKIAKEKMARRREQIKASASRNRRFFTFEESLQRLLYFMEDKETVLDVLGRLNKYRTRYKVGRHRTQTKSKKDNNAGAGSTDETRFQCTVNAVNMVTELLEIIQKKGVSDVYELTKGRVLELVEEELLGDEPVNNYHSKLWSFKWLNDPATLNKAFSNYEMQSWKMTYFQDSVIVKHVEDEDVPTNWLHISCLNFM
ncbi:LADA_0H02608g1_1 [Lachancea dasiensis]|uniref:LADA_0H02608g1_1 n=1 Tax=Lachancea dasiensis TaxID=1072105 RepID=A0A1G4JZU5_9SACH|nr:LADA_0H02608g1_1 [Lachancea dasiensis]